MTIPRDYDMRIAVDGTWYYRGTPISRKPMVKLFATVLRRIGEEYWLITPVERGRIQVDDAPFTAIGMTVRGDGRDREIVFITNLDEEVTAGADHPIRVSMDPETLEPRPYVLVREGLEALIARPVFYDMVELGEECDGADGPTLGLWSRGEYFELGRLEEIA